MVRSVSRALALLDETDTDGKSLSELARAVNLPTPTTLRLLYTLQQAGYVQRQGTRYFAGELSVRSRSPQ